MSLTLKDFKVGDIVELDCPNLLQNTRGTTVIVGKIENIFDALNKDGSEGNLSIDIRYREKWIRYIPSRDGGTIRIRGQNEQS